MPLALGLALGGGGLCVPMPPLRTRRVRVSMRIFLLRNPGDVTLKGIYVFEDVLEGLSVPFLSSYERA